MAFISLLHATRLAMPLGSAGKSARSASSRQAILRRKTARPVGATGLVGKCARLMQALRVFLPLPGLRARHFARRNYGYRERVYFFVRFCMPYARDARGCFSVHASLIVEKPFGRDLASARDLNGRCASGFSGRFDLPHRSLPGEGGNHEYSVFPLRHCSAASARSIGFACPDLTRALVSRPCWVGTSRGAG
jgi:Glucose-6-phosphate dehydrogenase, NAD binding domain